MPAPSSGLHSLHDLTLPELEARLEADGLNPVHARALWRVLFRDLDPDPVARTDLLPPVRRWLDAHWGHDITSDEPAVVARTESADGYTRKFLLRLDDGQEIETVVMGFPGRHTVCLSTQAGCALGCVFCATGQMGFARDLRAGEIVAQVVAARRWLRAAGQGGPRNIVLMGMGESLLNYDAVISALRIISDTMGLHVGPARISISTVGIVPGILRLAEERQPYPLAVSLHAVTDSERSALVPVNRRWPLGELIDACRTYGRLTGRRLFFSWTLIEGANDSPRHAELLAGLLAGLDAHVNLIPLNTTAGYGGRTPGRAAAHAFQAVLRRAGIPATLRQARGLDVAAGCGQLRAARVPGVAQIPSTGASQEKAGRLRNTQ